MRKTVCLFVAVFFSYLFVACTHSATKQNDEEPFDTVMTEDYDAMLEVDSMCADTALATDIEE